MLVLEVVYNFKRIQIYSLFTLSESELRLSMLIYVDDMIIAGNNTFGMESFKAYLNEFFKMKYMGPLKYNLGLRWPVPSMYFMFVRENMP